MFKHMRNTSTIRAALLTAAIIAVLAIFVSVPAGANDQTLSKSALKRLVASAETKADHERIAKYFDAEATKYEAEAKEHGELALFFVRNPDPAISKHPGSQRSFQHCNSLSKSLTQAAQDARSLAAEHREMSQQAK